MTRACLAALVLPIVVTATTLVSVSRNRAGAPEAMTLSERELPVTRRDDDNSATAVWLSWHMPARPEAPPRRDRSLPRRGYAVLELDGPALAALPLTRDGERNRLSRLVVVDAGVDPGALEARYPNRRTHLITAATLRNGAVVSVEPQRIAVPAEWAAQLGPRFEADVRYGSAYEPWITRIAAR